MKQKFLVYTLAGFMFLVLAHAGRSEGFYVANGFALAFFAFALGERFSFPS